MKEERGGGKREGEREIARRRDREREKGGEGREGHTRL